MSKEKVNKNCPGVKRLMREAAELAEPTEHYHAEPLEDNLFEWHFTVRGQEGSSFEGGVYHGRIMFPPEYPLKPPSVILLTPNGRFEINRKICLSISEYHPETWQPSWSIRTVLLAIVGFMPTPGKGAIGALDWTDAERRKLAAASVRWSCKTCGIHNSEVLLPVTKEGGDSMKKETEKYAAELSFTAEKNKSSAETGGNQENGANLPTSPTPNNTANSAVSSAPPAPPAPSSTSPAPSPDIPAPPTPTPASPQTSPNPRITERPQPTGGVCTLLLMYLLVGVISALFLRRAGRSIYQEYFQPDVV